MKTFFAAPNSPVQMVWPSPATSSPGKSPSNPENAEPGS
jgi:hypothetical protein